jgi:hypothetical protein
MAKFPLPLLPVWSVSPANVKLAEPVPTLVLLLYTGLTDWFRPPAPVTIAVQGVCADPV